MPRHLLDIRLCSGPRHRTYRLSHVHEARTAVPVILTKYFPQWLFRPKLSSCCSSAIAQIHRLCCRGYNLADCSCETWQWCARLAAPFSIQDQPSFQCSDRLAILMRNSTAKAIMAIIVAKAITAVILAKAITAITLWKYNSCISHGAQNWGLLDDDSGGSGARINDLRRKRP